ncbi:MAG TPA: hypothetical protein VGH28_26965 [Polyangiaceae bacterium]
MTTLGERIIERIEAASFAELAAVAFLALDDAPADREDPERVVRALERALARKNQFAASEPALRGVIHDATCAMFDAIARGEPREESMKLAAEKLRAAFRAVLGDAPREVASASYSPELQLAVLGLSIDSLREPILDVGCGPDALLVEHLRAAGKSARGIDFQIDGTDWLTFDYGAARWGTIVSHLGFSLHFMHQEMKSSEVAFEYARAYMRIVKSLAPGGTFAYVPGLPFIEAMLPPNALRVVRVPLAPELVTSAVASVQEATGLVLDAATHVTARP